MRELTPVPGEWLGRPFAETRWLLEATRLLVDPVAYGRGGPRGDGRAVVVLPGFLASDQTLLLLRRWLRIVGHSRGAHIARRSRDPDCFRARCSCAFIRDYTAEFPVDRVRLTSIYTKGDGVVRWERAVVDEADCVEVSGSHIGLMANRKAYRAIAAALARPELWVADAQ